MKTVIGFAFQFATFSPQNISGLDAGLDGKIQTAVNIRFSQSNSWIWQFPVLVRQSHIIKCIIIIHGLLIRVVLYIEAKKRSSRTSNFPSSYSSSTFPEDVRPCLTKYWKIYISLPQPYRQPFCSISLASLFTSLSEFSFYIGSARF